jgi:hypothetical protein
MFNPRPSVFLRWKWFNAWDKLRNRSLSCPKNSPKPLQGPLWAIIQRQADSFSGRPRPSSSTSVHSLRPQSSSLRSRTQSVAYTQSRTSSRTISYFAMNSNTNNAQDPVERTTSPYPDPRQLGPKSKILATRTSNYHSTSLRNMVSANTVNKTALHPGGVQYVYSFLSTLSRI